jgi:hypothetical protein
VEILSLVFPVLLFLSGNSGTFCQIAAPAQSQSALVKVPGTKVSLVPPSGLKPADRFPGFVDEETSSSIMVTELPVPYSEMAKGLTKETLATKGMNLLSRNEITLNGKPAILLHVAQEARSIAFLKWMIMTGNEKELVMVTATFPENLKTEFSSPMKQSALSVQWEADAEIDPLAGLNFTFKDDPALKFAKRFSNLVILTKDGALPGKPTNDPFFTIAPSFSQGIIPDAKKFAEKMLAEEDDISGLVIKKQSDVTIAGLQGIEIVAEAQSKKPDMPVAVYLVLLLDGNNYFRMQGIAPREEQEKYLAIFIRVAQSFRKK